MDGEPDRGCSIRSEKPSAKRGVFATARAAQKQFKEKLLKLGRECAISGEKLEALLDAAHIQSVKDGGPDEVNNGILLRADLHRLYDAGLFNIETDGAISRHKDLPAFYRQELREKKISPDIVNRIRPYLRRHKAVPRAHLFVE
jgi:predicted restriction endonuclease